MSSEESPNSPPSIVEDWPPKFPVVGIGASAGGLEAFKELFKVLPPDLGMAFVVIPHLIPSTAASCQRF
jgi:two-component system, chemotaxis family, CheB/CheR fusion protein